MILFPSSSNPPTSSPPTLAEVDASLGPVTVFLLAKSAFWLLLGGLLSLLASIKLHAPTMLSATPWLTYGRLLPAGWDLLVYGFAAQAAFAVGLWIVARASMQRLQAPVIVLIGGICWNLGLLAGLIGFLIGDTTGRELLEMPAGAMAILMVGATLIGASGWMTFAERTEESTYPSAWFVLLALLAIAWCGTGALMMLAGEGARGVVQVLVQRWFSLGFLRLGLGGVALAVLFHFLPLAVHRPLASRSLALWAFWPLALFGAYGVTAHGDPFPRWVVSVGLAGQAFSMIAVLAIAINWWKTTEGAWGALFGSTSGRLIGTAALSYVLAESIRFVVSFPWSSGPLRFTWIEPGLDWLFVGGAVMLALFAVLPMLVLRSVGREMSPGLVRFHAWATGIGVLLIALPFILAGLVQGLGLASGNLTFMEALHRSLMLVRVTSLGYFVFFLGQFAWVLALAGVLKGVFVENFGTLRAWIAPVNLKRTEARS